MLRAFAEPVLSGVPDNWNFNASNPCLHVGGNYSQNLNHGLFYVNYNTASNSNSSIGARLLFSASRELAAWLTMHRPKHRAPLGDE